MSSWRVPLTDVPAHVPSRSRSLGFSVSRRPSGIADPVGGFCLPQGLLRRFWGVWLCFRKNVLLRRHWEAEAADRRVLQAFLGVHPKRNSFSKLLVAHTSFHSACTLSRPRKLKRRKPRCSLIWPEDGFDDGFAHLVNRSSRLGAQFVLHGLLGRGLVRRRSALCRHCLIVLPATGG